MSPDVILLIVFLLIALSFSFFCSVAEAVLLSISPSFTASLRDTNSGVAELIERLKENVERPLAAILSLNTIAHTVGAAGVGAQAQIVFEGKYIGLTSAILTLLILILSEIIPKTLGAVYWRPLAPIVCRSVAMLIWLMYPLVVMSEWLAKLIAPAEAHPTVTREEVAALAARGAEEGHLHNDESRILNNLFRFRVLKVKDIMTPRPVVLALPQSMTVGEAMEKHPKLQFSRVPLFEETRDEIVGFVLKTDILLAQAHDEHDKPLSEMRRDIVTIRPGASLSQLFETLIDTRAHLALVVDEYGGFAGLATLEDLVETLFGLEIVDEADRAEDMQALARQKWLERAKSLGLDVEELTSDVIDEPKP
ncbi:CNNM domain-containing protein [Fuerstiella marisgermanici]|uniref:Hemolysin C n=1 Tax=Fuerstiella marisgermanici TaxID=1891926 RepID=A0A1P8WJ58_9PLAN|nr:hemolysin family protein [Fuerstiella marisgermanici]APZ94078.1 Hemolysin C [Fuerstiella marisgermanici]